MKKTKKGVKDNPVIKERRDLTVQELKEYNELIKVCNMQHWKAGQINSNTALIPNGQDVGKTEEAIAKLLENSKNNWLSHILSDCGIPVGQSVNINTETGEIKEVVKK